MDYELRTNTISILENVMIQKFDKINNFLDERIIVKSDVEVYYFDDTTLLFHLVIPYDGCTPIDTAIKIYVNYFFDKKLTDNYNYLLNKSSSIRFLYNSLKFSKNSKVQINSNVPYEIPYRNKILNLRDLSLRERTCKDKYMSSIYVPYIKNYKEVPDYIREVFGGNFRTVQKILGSTIVNPLEKRVFFFYGSIEKSRLIEEMSNIFYDFIEVLKYDEYISLLSSQRTKNKRVLVFEKVDLDLLISKCLINIKHTLIILTDEKPTMNHLLALKRPYSLLHFPNIAKDMDTSLLFSWIVKGAHMYLRKKSNFITKLFNC